MALKQGAAWLSLSQHRHVLAGLRLRDLFDKDPHRFRRFSVELDGMLLDFSKNPVTEDTLQLLLELAREADLEAWRQRLFAGEPVNISERRPALHMALRGGLPAPVELDGVDVQAEAAAVLQRMEQLVAAIRDGSYVGFKGDRITDLIHIGIGGSDLGPRLALQALADRHDGPRVHFVSNIDGVELADCTARLRPETTLVTVVSKSFTTAETCANAEAAKQWLLDAGADAQAIRRHFIAVSNNSERAQAFGIAQERLFPIWDWVGGRYSLWSAVGLPVAIGCGMDAFHELLAGARRMDQHFLSAPMERNLPILLGLLGIWQINFLGAATHAVIPYTERLARLPAYLEQLEMESNGKLVTRDGQPVDYQTAPVVWGATGTVGQHAFFQALHQGTQAVPVDFIGVAKPVSDCPRFHEQLLANLFAQSEALMRGQDADEARAQMAAQGLAAEQIDALLPFRLFPGNRSSTTLLLRELTPRMLGMLIALYEHKVFTQSVIWRVNAFDQWGVELGKQLAARLLPALRDDQDLDAHDASTRGLVEWYRAWR